MEQIEQGPKSKTLYQKEEENLKTWIQDLEKREINSLEEDEKLDDLYYLEQLLKNIQEFENKKQLTEDEKRQLKEMKEEFKLKYGQELEIKIRQGIIRQEINR